MMKTLFSKKSGIALSMALTASLLAGTAHAGPRGDATSGTASGCNCGGGTTTSSPSSSPSKGDAAHPYNQDMCVVAPEVLKNDGKMVVFRGHIERWQNVEAANGREIDVYNQLISMSVANYKKMLENSARPRSTGIFGIGSDDRRVFRLGLADRDLTDPLFIEKACTSFSRLLGKYDASLITQSPFASTAPVMNPS